MATGASQQQRAEDAALLKLASAQRMNTNSRRAAFCVLMAADGHVRHPTHILAIEKQRTSQVLCQGCHNLIKFVASFGSSKTLQS